MQLELKRMQREVGITFIYVTHDQDEALTMSDRIAVMNDGRIEQSVTPADIYDASRDRRSSPASSATPTLAPSRSSRFGGRGGVFGGRPCGRRASAAGVAAGARLSAGETALRASARRRDRRLTGSGTRQIVRDVVPVGGAVLLSFEQGPRSKVGAQRTGRRPLLERGDEVPGSACLSICVLHPDDTVSRRGDRHVDMVSAAAPALVENRAVTPPTLLVLSLSSSSS